MSDPSQNISSLLNETRVFNPKPAHSLGFDRWHVDSLADYKARHARSIAEPERFWAEEASRLAWFKPWQTVLDWQPPDAKWFVGGELNACYNCIDRHLEAGLGDRIAFYW
mgnify:CR=1 FL=1